MERQSPEKRATANPETSCLPRHVLNASQAMYNAENDSHEINQLVQQTFM
jgi:hypothetical protein